jgi:hypothetical protein
LRRTVVVQEKVRLAEISIPSTQIEDCRLQDFDGSLTIRYTYYVDDVLCESGIDFDWSRAYRYRAESHCSVWYIDAYDTVVEVKNSEWVAELLEATPKEWRDRFEMHHYMIYLDSAGCFEVVAKSWKFLDETEIGTR